jgi:DNA mismatch repair ATPase MutS
MLLVVSHARVKVWEARVSALRFDWRLKPGVAARSNALAILRMIGVLKDG